MPVSSGHFRISGWILAGLLLASSWALPATGEAGPPEVPPGLPAQALVQHADSGAAPGTEPAWNTVVGDPYAGWVRVFFGSETRLRPGAQIRLTSLQDGAQQHLVAETLQQWADSSAYFNGPEVLVELLSAPAGGSRVVVVGLWAGISPSATESICFGDDRILSSDPRAGRLLTQGCTGWLLNECLVTAGHCMLGNEVVQFNVPLSNSNGTLNHPPASDQYSVDRASQQFFNPGGGAPAGNDWAYFGAFPNSETGLTPLQAQGAHYVLASNVPPVASQTLRLTGYGVDTTPSQNTQVQQTDAGPFHSFLVLDTTLGYQVDTFGGSSGSAVEEEGSQRVIGIHTNLGCTASGGDNLGTAINHAGFQDALRNPLGVCAGQPACNNDGICDPGEDCFNCVNDCVYLSPAVICGDGTCNTADGEDCRNCPDDCNEATTGPQPRPCCGDDAGCGDALCTGGGNVCSPVAANGSGYCCGDGLCQNAENDTDCSVDCGVCVATQEVMNLRIEPMSPVLRFSWDATGDPCLINYVLLGNNDPSSPIFNIVARTGLATSWLANPLFSYYLVVVEDELGDFGPWGHYGK